MKRQLYYFWTFHFNTFGTPSLILSDRPVWHFWTVQFEIFGSSTLERAVRKYQTGRSERSTVESGRSLSVKADDPGKDESRRSRLSRRSLGQSRRSWAKEDDLRSTADDLLSQSRRSMGLSRRSWAKAEISGAQSRRSYLKSHSVKADDLKGRKQTILTNELSWVNMSCIDDSWWLIMTYGGWLWIIVRQNSLGMVIEKIFTDLIVYAVIG